MPRRRTRVMMWLSAVVIAATVAVALLVEGTGVKLALLFLAASLCVFALIRAVSPAPGPYGISVRSRTFDVTLLLAFALVIAAITLTLPTAALG